MKTVLLTKGLSEKLKGWASSGKEFRGFLIYEPQGNTCLVELAYRTSVKSDGFIKKFQDRLDFIYHFLKSNRSYQFIMFQTTPFEHEIDFNGLIFTPNYLFFQGLEDYELEVCSNYYSLPTDYTKQQLTIAKEEVEEAIGHKIRRTF